MYEFQYHRPGSAADAIAVRAKADDGSFLAGGMTILPTMKLRLASPSDLVDLAGIGDLRGITSRVQYLQDLGIDAVWLSPFYPSALADGGYDVDDYRDVDPKIGTLTQFEAVIAALHERDIKVIVDIVPNHMALVEPLWRNAPVWETLREGRRGHDREGGGKDAARDTCQAEPKRRPVECEHEPSSALEICGDYVTA